MSSLKKGLFLVAVSSLLLSLASCGNDSKSSRKSKVLNPVCDSIDCLSSVDWKINLQGQVFPGKTRLEINDETVLDECMSKQQYQIDRDAAPQSITLYSFRVPKKGQVKMKIVDQGWDCSQERVFLYRDNVDFTLTKGLNGRFILINL